MKLATLFAAIAAVAASATIPMTANAETFTTNGVTWTYTVDSAKNKTAILGGLSGLDDNTTTLDDTNRAMPKATEIDALKIPWKFTSNDTNYTVTALGSRAFHGCTGLTGNLCIPSTVKNLSRACLHQTNVRVASLGGVTRIQGYVFQQIPAQPFPDISGVTTLAAGTFYGSKFTGTARVPKGTGCTSWRLFSHCANLEAVLVIGPDTVASGTQSYTTFSMDEFADQSTNLKVIFMGPNTKGTTFNQTDALNGVTGCKMFVPANGFWDEFNPSAVGNEIVYYGSSTNLDFIVDDDAKLVIAKPVTESALVKALEVAPLCEERTRRGDSSYHQGIRLFGALMERIREVNRAIPTKRCAKW